MSLLLLFRSPQTTFKHWNGTVESALTVDGVWNGTTVVALGSSIVVNT